MIDHTNNEIGSNTSFQNVNGNDESLSLLFHVEMINNPYMMCSIEECNERIRCNEVSIFECNTLNDNNSSNRILDPCIAISKYRRSAAGSDRQKYPIRSLQQIYNTIQYLIQLLFLDNIPISVIQQQQQQRHHITSSIKYIHLIELVQDRIRAIQVDLTILTLSSSCSSDQNLRKDIQYYITLCHIITLYLMSDIKDYDKKFIIDALQASLYNYWTTSIDYDNDDNDVSVVVQNIRSGVIDTNNSSSSNNNNRTNNENSNNINNKSNNNYYYSYCKDDEMLSLLLIYQLNSTIQLHIKNNQSTFDSSFLLSSFTSIYRKNINYNNNKYLLLQWTFQLISYCCNHQWYMLLKMIHNGPTSCYSNNDNNKQQQYMNRFSIIVRCILSTSISYIRYHILQYYNISFQKNHIIQTIEIAKLLYFIKEKESKKSKTSAWDDDDDNDIGNHNNYEDDTDEMYDYSNEMTIQFGIICGLVLSHKLSTSPPAFIFKNSESSFKNNYANTDVSLLQPIRTIENDYFILRNNNHDHNDNNSTTMKDSSSTTNPTIVSSRITTDGILIPSVYYLRNNIFF